MIASLQQQFQESKNQNAIYLEWLIEDTQTRKCSKTKVCRKFLEDTINKLEEET